MSLLNVPHLPAWRKAAGLSQDELARRAGVSHSTIEALESTKRPTRARHATRARLAAALGVAANALLYPPPLGNGRLRPSRPLTPQPS